MAKPTLDHKTVKRQRRLVVTAEVMECGGYGRTRDVTLESRDPNGAWQAEMFDLCKACEPFVVDMVRWAVSIHLDVVFDPTANMEAYFTAKKRNDQDIMFS